MVDTISALYHASEHQHRTLTFKAISNKKSSGVSAGACYTT